MKLTSKEYFIFSGGEVHCKIPGKSSVDISRIVCLDYSMNGFMALCQYKEVLDRKKCLVDLVYPYLPYARQDRIMLFDEPFSLKVFCELLNSQNFNSVTLWDPHSDVAPALIDRCQVYVQWRLARSSIPTKYFEDDNVIFVSPDAGAYKKLSKLVLDDKKIAIGVKNRDTEGNISHTDIFSPVSLQDKTCVIVDDICDGGRTFIELAKVLKERGAKKIYLYVTHGIFSNGFKELLKYIDHIYTTGSFPNESNEFLTISIFP